MGHQRQEDRKMRCSELAAFRSTAFRHNSAGLGFAVSADSLCLRVSTYVSANGRAWFRHASSKAAGLWLGATMLSRHLLQNSLALGKLLALPCNPFPS